MMSFSFPMVGNAKTVRDLMNELNALEAQDQQNKQDKNLTQDQINRTNQTINEITSTITKAKEEVVTLSEEIEKLDKKIAKKDEEIKTLMNFLQISNGENAYLEYAFGAQGINYGINIKKSAGAGIPEHLHLHVLPRYNGDTNFMSTIAECRVYGSDFLATYQKIKTLAKTYLNPKKED